jgi:hypothetical protein
MYKMNMGLEESVQKDKKLNGRIERYIVKSMRKEVTLIMHKVIEEPAPQCGNGTWVLREEIRGERVESSEMRFLWPLLGVSLTYHEMY